ncbi:MAG TPA: hypothetical protein VFS00_23585, partial [Polyangiaceae bacterium]|nr:hypothetical protein [Polyangiaceae bacterium]
PAEPVTPVMTASPAPAAAPTPAPPVQERPEAVVRTLPAAEGGSAYRWMAAAAAVLLLLSVGANWLFYNRWKDTEAQLAVAQSEQARYAAATQAVEKRLANRTQELGVLRSDQFRAVVMTGTPKAPGARARVLFNPATRAARVRPARRHRLRRVRRRRG